MRYVDEFRDAGKAQALAAQIAALCEPGRQYKFMEVCGGHTHSIYKYGVDDLLPANVELVHGPGCPVCVIPMGRVDDAIDRTWSDVGGYVRGFEAGFDPSGFRIDAETIAALDPLFHWVLAGVRQALGGDAPARTGLVLGNLSFPTSSMSRYAESVWLDAQGARYAGARAKRDFQFRGVAAQENDDLHDPSTLTRALLRRARPPTPPRRASAFRSIAIWEARWRRCSPCR